MNNIKAEAKVENSGNSKVTVSTESSAKAEAKAKAVSEVSIEIQNLLGETELLKEDIDRELKIKKVPDEEIALVRSDIEVAEQAMQEIQASGGEDAPVKSKNRLKRFIDDLSDETSSIHKALKLLRRGKDYGVTLAETYNKVAGNIGMPLVPPLALEVIKKL